MDVVLSLKKKREKIGSLFNFDCWMTFILQSNGYY